MEDPVLDGRRRAQRLALLVVVLLALLAIVAFASRSGYGHRAAVARPAPAYVDWAMSVFLVLFVLAIPFAVYAYWLQQHAFRREHPQRSFQSRVVQALLVLLIVPLLALAIAWLRRHGHFPTLSSLGFGNGRGAGAGHGKSTTTPYSPKFQWPVLWATLALLALALGLLWWSWRRRRDELRQRPPVEPAVDVADEVAASIGEAIDDLEAEPDARRAVVAAYARMEATFARNGLDRRPSETPVEYLRRILLELTARGDAVERLTALFEQAKFSHHAIDAGMKREAIHSLQAIRDDLRRAAA
jgi:hypothetical protein